MCCSFLFFFFYLFLFFTFFSAGLRRTEYAFWGQRVSRLIRTNVGTVAGHGSEGNFTRTESHEKPSQQPAATIPPVKEKAFIFCNYARDESPARSERGSPNEQNGVGTTHFSPFEEARQARGDTEIPNRPKVPIFFFHDFDTLSKPLKSFIIFC